MLVTLVPSARSLARPVGGRSPSSRATGPGTRTTDRRRARPIASTTNRRSSAIAPAGPIPGRELFIRALDLVSSTDQRRPLTNQPLGVLAQSGRYVPSRQLQEAGIAAVGPGLDPLRAEAQLRR